MRHTRPTTLLALSLMLIACGSAAPTVAPSASSVDAPIGTIASRVAPASAAPVSAAPATQPISAPTTVVTVPAQPTPTVTPTPTPRVVIPIAPGAVRHAIVPPRSQATYRAGEKFLGQEISVRVATVSGVTGDLYIDRQRPSASSVSTITVPIRGLVSDMPDHDRVRDRFLETTRYPNVTFTPQRLVGLPDTPYTDGQLLTFQIVGEMTMRGATSPVAFDVTGTLSGTTFSGTAKAKVQITDFGLTVPTLTALELDNNIYLEITLIAEQQR